jgi:eukaryotic-like serine/threonine-protein kinase
VWGGNVDSAQATAFTAELQDKSLNGWTISGQFGFGKSAVVLPAVRDGVEVAIKVFHPELIGRFGRAVQLKRIAREKALIGQTHPNLVRILDAGECSTTGYLYVVMDRVPYKSLRDVLTEVPLDAIPRLIAQVASAARFLEDMGLVHRDIKPENIAVAPDFSSAILLDLGVVKPLLDANITDVDARRFIGTLRYSSPEFLLRQEEQTILGGRAITFYQLGAVLHDMLMRKPLFAHHVEPYSVLVQAVIEEKPEIFGDDVKRVALAKRCLIKNPAVRVEIVQWNDFLSHTEESAASLAVLQAKLAARQQFIRADQKSSDFAATELDRLAKHRLEDVANRFASRIASILNASNLFPLRTTKLSISTQDKTCTTIVKFMVDDELGLKDHLLMRFVIGEVDQNFGEAMYRSSCCCALAGKEVVHQIVEKLEPLKQFYVGQIDGLLDSPELETQFAFALNAAYEAVDRGVTLKPDDLHVLAQEV